MLNSYQEVDWEENVLPALVPASFQDSDDEDALQGRKPFDIHQYFGLSPETPICLDSLQDPDPGQKPPYTYATLVKLAIWSSPQRKLTLKGIYDALERRFPWFKTCDNPNAWKTSIRHSLSLLSVFQKLPQDLREPVKGHYWTVDFSKGDGYKRPRKRGHKPAKEEESPAKAGASTSSKASSSKAEIVNAASQSMRMLTPPPFHRRRITITPSSAPARTTHSQEWQEDSARSSRVFSPYPSVIQLAAVSSDKRYRHYRMCTYLYPDDISQEKVQLDMPPTPSMHIWDKHGTPRRPPMIEQSSDDDPPARAGSYAVASETPPETPSTSSPLVGISEQYLQNTEFFSPSPASYEAYHAASATAALNSQQSFDYDFPDHNIKLRSSVRMRHREARKENNRRMARNSRGTGFEPRGISDDAIDPVLRSLQENGASSVTHAALHDEDSDEVEEML